MAVLGGQGARAPEEQPAFLTCLPGLGRPLPSGFILASEMGARCQLLLKDSQAQGVVEAGCAAHIPLKGQVFCQWTWLLGSRLGPSVGTVLSYRIPPHPRSHLPQGGTRTWPLLPNLGQM